MEDMGNYGYTLFRTIPILFSFYVARNASNQDDGLHNMLRMCF